MDGSAAAQDTPVLTGLTSLLQEAVSATDTYKSALQKKVSAVLAPTGKIDRSAFSANQHLAHGYGWIVTYIETLRETANWASRLEAEGKLGEIDALLAQILFSKYLADLVSGVPMNQGETIRPHEMDALSEVETLFDHPAVRTLITDGLTPATMAAAAAHLPDSLGRATVENTGEDETMSMIRDQFRRYAENKIVPHAHDWHLQNEYIPMEVVNEMAELGVFGLTIPEEFGGLGMGKTAMCVVTEELSRGYIGVGSLGTRSEIAAELIRLGGTDTQKTEYLPKIASGEILPTAVFTEPNTGSDLASLKTRATLDGDLYRVTGNKTWITHAARTDMMTLLCRTNADEPGYKGLSMLLVDKPRGTEDSPFPKDGMSGGEIEVLGYRGMKEYELAFDNMEVPASALLGGTEGQGFKQLMATFESARIQTAARAVGVAQNAMELGLKYATERIQFGKPIYKFPRVAGKIAWMAVETMMARQISYFAAREKDSDRRCDIEAGMAKLLAARVAWSNADNALQVHGGNGYALEYPISRVLCDARILNIFEGAAEIQAHVIARGLLSGRN